MKKAAVIAFFCLVPLTGLPGQKQSPFQPNAPFKLTVGANLVLVPVVVTDKRGMHVTGLKAEDFELREDGKQQRIASIDEITAEKGAVQHAVVAPNSFTNQLATSRPRKLQIILLDLLNTPLAGRAEARRGLIDFLSKSVDTDALLALLVLRADGVHMVHNFTKDPSVLIAAVRSLRAPAASAESPALPEDEAGQLQAFLAGKAATAQMAIHPTPGAAVAQMHGVEALTDISREGQESLVTLECLQQIARYFAAVPGRKSLIWASTGFRFALGAVAGAETRGTTLDDWQRTIRMLQDANIAMYPVSTGGIGGRARIAVTTQIPQGPGGGSIDALAAGLFTDNDTASHQTMDHLASMTGGQAFYGLNDSDEFFRRASQDSSQYYVLTYYTKSTPTPGWRKLSVQVRGEGLRVRARDGFFFNNGARDPESARQSEEFRALTSSLESTSVPMAGQWKQTELVADQRKIHFVLTLPSGAISIDTEQEKSMSVDFLVYAWNAAGKESGKIGQRLERKLSPGEATQIQAQGISYENALTLPPGDYEVHFVVRDNLAGRLGSVVTQLRVE